LESEAQPLVMAAIQLDRNSPARSATQRRGWITSSLATTHQFKEDSRALILKTPALIQRSRKPGMDIPTQLTTLSPILIQMGRR
jgi:hypothetical protein